MTVTRRAPAKINLALHVTGRRGDGFHELESLVVFTDFGDRMSVSPAEADALTLAGPFAAALAEGAANLVERARDALRERAARPCGPVVIGLEKNLPIASGIGGGSSDAAAALRALAELWEIDPDNAGIAETARMLGADVPMCLEARPLIARGVGHDIEKIDDFPALPIVLVNPAVAVSTPEVFRRLAAVDNAPMPALPAFDGSEDVATWLAATRNDLQPAAMKIAPQIAEALGELDDAGASFTRMSGSGATCFGIFADPVSADAAAQKIASRRAAWFVVATRTGASGEAP